MIQNEYYFYEYLEALKVRYINIKMVKTLLT